MITPLYSGADLERAAGRKPSGGGGTGSPFRTARALVRHLTEAARKAPLVGCRELVCHGNERHSGRPLSIRYIGTAAQLHFLTELCFDGHRIVHERPLATPGRTIAALRQAGADEDFLWVDAESWIAGPLVRRPGLRLPTWIKQHLEIRDEWNDVVGALPRATRRGVARFLRKYGYQGRLNGSAEALDDFYHRLYRPYVSDRHGEGALVVSERLFRSECRGGLLVELLHDGEVVGANLLRRSGKTMSIVWCGLSEKVETSDLKGASDVLDYFSILHAFRSGCDRLDFGPSRPRLNDGLLVYKSKWDTHLGAGRLRKPPLVVAPRTLSPAVVPVLSENHWITSEGGRLVGRILRNGGPLTNGDAEELQARHGHPGIASLNLYALAGLADDLSSAEWRTKGVNVIDLRGAPDPLAVYLR